MRRLPLTFALLLVAACASAGEVLTPKYTEDASSTTNIQQSTKQTLTIAGMPIETSANTFQVISSKTGKRAADGTLRVETKIDKLQAQYSFPGGLALNFDSGNPGAKSDNPELEKLLAMMRATSKSKWTTVLDKDNKVTAIEGRDDFLDTLAPDLAQTLKRTVEPEYLKAAAAAEAAAIPSREVNVGDVWEQSSELRLDGDQTLNFQNRYEYLGKVDQGGKSLHKIGVTQTAVTYTMNPASASPLKITSSELKPEESEGYLLFDGESGQTVEQRSKVRITGPMKMTFMGMQLDGALDLTIESSATEQ